MSPTARNIIALIGGLAAGFVVNMGIVTISHHVIALPAGVDPNDMESLKANMHLFQSKHFIMPFLAHALGVLVGAFIAAKFAASKEKLFAYIIGGFFLLGGIMAAYMLPAPTWFIAFDLIVSYIPMAWLGLKLSGK